MPSVAKTVSAKGYVSPWQMVTSSAYSGGGCMCRVRWQSESHPPRVDMMPW